MDMRESLDLLNLIKGYYPVAYTRFTSDEAKQVVVLWQDAFPQMPFDIMVMALKRYTKTQRNPPTIADMREELRKIHDETETFLSYPPFLKKISADEIARRRRILAVTGERTYEFHVSALKSGAHD